MNCAVRAFPVLPRLRTASFRVKQTASPETSAMSIVLVGVNHKSAPVEVRERLALTEDACASGLRNLVDGEVVREGLIVSTCNRVEVLAETSRERLNDTIE